MSNKSFITKTLYPDTWLNRLLRRPIYKGKMRQGDLVGFDGKHYRALNLGGDEIFSGVAVTWSDRITLIKKGKVAGVWKPSEFTPIVIVEEENDE